MEIRKSDRGILIEILGWLSERPCPSSESVDAVKTYVSAHLDATKGESSSWQTQSRQLITETEEEANRLLATKFIADEAVGLVKELTAALKGIENEAIANEAGNPGYPSPWAAVLAALAKAAAFTAAGTGPAPAPKNLTFDEWIDEANRTAKYGVFSKVDPADTAPTVGGATETQIFPPVEPE